MSKRYLVEPPLEVNFKCRKDVATDRLEAYEALTKALADLDRKFPGYRIVSPAFLRLHPWKLHVKKNTDVDQLVIYSDVPTAGFAFSPEDEDCFARPHQERVLLLERVD